VSSSVDEAGLPSFAQTQAATDGERDVHLVYYAFDLLHLEGLDVSSLPLIERKSLLEPLVANKPGLQFNGCQPSSWREKSDAIKSIA
jgi:bifunctional non-homologous end joining protein LigD